MRSAENNVHTSVLVVHCAHISVVVPLCSADPSSAIQREPPAAATLEAKLRREGVDSSSVVDSGRERTAPERFSDTKHAQWSAYDMNRLDCAHNPVRTDVDEAVETEPSLKAELDALFSCVRGAASMSAGSSSAGVHATSEMEAEMGQVGATCLHSALLEMLAASTDEEVPHLWHDSAAAAVITVRARMGDADHGTWGDLAVAPPSLTFTPGGATAEAAAADGTCAECMEPLFTWPLESFAGVNDDSDEHSRCELRLLQGEDDGLLFGFENGISLVRFESTLRVASLSARAAATPAATTEAGPSSARGAGGSIADSTSDGASAGEQPKRQRKEEPRVVRGRELKEGLAKVASLYVHHKSAQAKAAMAAIPQGRRPHR